MANAPFQHVTIVGVGLLGGSVGLALKAAWPEITVAGVGRRQSSLDEALAARTIDEAYLDAREPAARSDLVLLATPVGAFEAHLRNIVDVLADGAVVTDVGSTKARVVATAEEVCGPGGPFVGSHPMAGSHQKGPSFARADLFDGATCIVTPTQHTSAALVERVEALWKALNMRVVRMAPGDHDAATARVSHLPHALASLLMLLPGDADLDVSATGFRDATRLASGDPEMWRDIFLTNRDAVAGALDELAASIAKFRRLIESGDGEGIEAFLAEAKARRDSTIAQRFSERRVAME